MKLAAKLDPRLNPIPASNTAPLPTPNPAGQRAAPRTAVRLFLCGDVMLGRGIDQILPHPGQPGLHEPYVRSATRYVKLAVRATGRIPSPADAAYPWGDALAVLAERAPQVRIVNLETAVTTSESWWPDKRIHYRMHPANLASLTWLVRAGTDCCVLANNHVLDWGHAGLDETLACLHEAGIRTAGAGRDAQAAAAPAVIELEEESAAGVPPASVQKDEDAPPPRRLLVYAYGSESAGVPPAWAASARHNGVNVLPDLSIKTADAVARHVTGMRRPGDLVVISLHWGDNWGFHVSRAEQAFAERLIDAGAADVIHGHSSHHVRAIEVYRGKPVFYGCGDFMNDYEGIPGHAQYRPDLTLMYFPVLDAATGLLSGLEAVPMRIRHFRLTHARDEDIAWLHETLAQQGERFGVRVERAGDAQEVLAWRW
nr:CapA family protein [Paraburkholderia kururiensis]